MTLCKKVGWNDCWQYLQKLSTMKICKIWSNDQQFVRIVNLQQRCLERLFAKSLSRMTIGNICKQWSTITICKIEKKTNDLQTNRPEWQFKVPGTTLYRSPEGQFVILDKWLLSLWTNDQRFSNKSSRMKIRKKRCPERLFAK